MLCQLHSSVGKDQTQRDMTMATLFNYTGLGTIETDINYQKLKKNVQVLF